MPQMAPMWWTLISILSFSLLMIMMIVTYFSYTKIMKNNLKNSTNHMYWKW